MHTYADGATTILPLNPWKLGPSKKMILPQNITKLDHLENSFRSTTTKNIEFNHDDALAAQ